MNLTRKFGQGSTIFIIASLFENMSLTTLSHSFASPHRSDFRFLSKLCAGTVSVRASGEKRIHGASQEVVSYFEKIATT